jgi:hypothetical protein
MNKLKTNGRREAVFSFAVRPYRTEPKLAAH